MEQHTKSSSKKGQREGTVRWRDGTADVRLSLGKLGRKTFQLPTCKTAEQAERRRELLADLAKKLDAAGRLGIGLPLLEKIAAREGKDLANAIRAATMMANGEVLAMATGAMTIEALADKWTSGELARLYPNYLKPKKSARMDIALLNTHVLDLVRDIPVTQFTLEHAQEVLRRMPPREQGTQRQVAQVMNRMMNIAVFPLCILKANPLPRGFVPPASDSKAKSSLYPDEDRRLLARTPIDLEDRLLYGTLDREGLRYEEAVSLEWTDLDLDRGGIELEENKTDDPRAWALQAGTVRALRAWREMRKDDPSPLVFVRRSQPAERFRRHLRAAGVDRAVLFEHNETRRRIRVHDLRATFVTLGLANGRTETWISDRTGHRSSIEINKYRRAARKIVELGLGDLTPLDEAIPEIASALRAAEDVSERRDGMNPDGSHGAEEVASGAEEVASGAEEVASNVVEATSHQDDVTPTMKTPGSNQSASPTLANEPTGEDPSSCVVLPSAPPADHRARAAGLVRAWSKRRRRAAKRIEQRRNAREIVPLASPRDVQIRTKF